MPEYANRTRVPVEKSKTDIEKAMRRWGVDGFMTAWEGDSNIVAFKFKGLQARIALPAPDTKSDEIKLTPTGMVRTQTEQNNAYQQALRQRWRAMLLFVKATLEAVDSGIITFEEAFFPYLVLPDNTTIKDSMMPQIYGALEAGEMPPMLPEGRR